MAPVPTGSHLRRYRGESPGDATAVGAPLIPRLWPYALGRGVPPDYWCFYSKDKAIYGVFARLLLRPQDIGIGVEPGYDGPAQPRPRYMAVFVSKLAPPLHRPTEISSD